MDVEPLDAEFGARVCGVEMADSGQLSPAQPPTAARLKQRLTGLYSVIKGKEVVTAENSREAIRQQAGPSRPPS